MIDILRPENRTNPKTPSVDLYSGNKNFIFFKSILTMVIEYFEVLNNAYPYLNDFIEIYEALYKCGLNKVALNVQHVH